VTGSIIESTGMINFCQFGAGRIGAIHAANIAAHLEARLSAIIDTDRAAAERLAGRYGAVLRDQAEALADPAIDAALIASSTDTHADLVEAAARAGKAIFCEKPLDLDRRRAEACAAVAEQCGVPLMVAFNRRFDPNFARLEHEIRTGRIGRPEILRITSYDPAPPPIEFVRRSGGMFRDMMIHDLDMACWLLGEEPVELFAAASVMVDPAIGEAGDVDTAVVTLRMKSGALCQIANTRRAVYGYDQRIEVLGSKGGISAENVVESTVVFAGEEGVVSDKPLPFFLQRYAEAYRCELDHFITAVSSGTPPSVGAKEGIRALVLADAAVESARTGGAVKL
jgi:myo-inositol 2-dehydrogenase/D-chiro-inositol 1-dehydrogenase